jgi:hypothetical protein
MSSSIRLVIALHNHQPVGNFDGVIDAAYLDSYGPFLDVLEEFPEIPISLHTSGCLMEWLVAHRPEYIERLRGFVQRGQIEILGGPFYEPILACIPRRDRVGQIQLYSRYLEQLFGVQVRGMWVPERVWEPGFAGDITEAGIEFTLVDDSHFKAAGLPEDKLHGYYLTEDEGRLLKIFPDSEKLRYTIPFAEVSETIDYLRGLAENYSDAVAVFGDDGEKFGVWPGTKEHVFDKGWLRSFFKELQANRDWIRVLTLGQSVDEVAPMGRVYLPNASYREMTEWALDTDQQVAYKELVEQQEKEVNWLQLRQFVRAGFWRNFLVKYPESNEMYCRMREISDQLQHAQLSPRASQRPDLLAQAQTELYRGECNCPYWHGAFGGLYLPHLRNAIYRHLIMADTLLEQFHGRTGRWVDIEAEDFNLDARKEVRISSDRLIAYFAPARGGHLYELDLRSTNVNLLATLNRRPEPYHQKVIAAAAKQREISEDDILDLNDQVKFKQPDLDKKIQYDTWPRKSLVDHFLTPGLPLGDFQQSHGEIGSFVQGVYETRLRKSDTRVEAVMTRDGYVGEHLVRITKTVGVDTETGSLLDIQYDLENLPPGERIHFAVEFNFAAMASGADDRYFYNAHGQQIGQLQTVHDLDDTDRIGLVDEWLGVDASLDLSQRGGIWTMPIQTVSQSEGGFELVHQSTCVVPHWEFTADSTGNWSVRIRMTLDTSAAQARMLTAAAT